MLMQNILALKKYTLEYLGINIHDACTLQTAWIKTSYVCTHTDTNTQSYTQSHNTYTEKVHAMI